MQREIIAIVSRVAGRPESEIGPDTDLVCDLGFVGDDAYELVRQIVQVYPIELSGVDLSKLFGVEGIWPWQAPLLLFRGIKHFVLTAVAGRPRHEVLGRSVRISDVVDSAISGTWTLRDQ